MTEQEYIISKTTKADKIKSNLFYIPVVIFALGIIYYMFTDAEMERAFFGVVLILFIPCAYLNNRVSRKIQRLRMEYRYSNKK